ncbi:uncharacterized protein UTRI_04975_B [Ustilago trichophora]|uniref:GLTSCR protein conserved domain-containing protein n=1 Tax=Ustilago trichophora TaxID=86804 RepID=A0A5C3EGW7_9BASI|nr:uncharacterized protein UTRI_04975_B [Ustilago trichophora]
MQAYSPVSTSTSQPHNTNSTNAPLTIDPAALFGGSTPSASATASTSASGSAAIGADAASSNTNAIHSSTLNSIAVKQEPDDEHASSLSHAQPAATPSAQATDDDAVQQKSTLAAPRPRVKTQSSREDGSDGIELIDIKAQSKDAPTSLVAEFLRRDQNAILRPDLSAFTDARDALRRLLPYHVWNIPHHDLLKSLGLKEDPILSEVRLRKRRRIELLDNRKRNVSRDAINAEPSRQAVEKSAEAGPSSVKLDSSDGMQVDGVEVKADSSPSANIADQQDSSDPPQFDVELNELGLPTPLPEVPQPDFPTLDFAESVFARRDALASRFRRTLTALDTEHKRAPNTSLSLEHLERLAYNDDREEVLAQIEELKDLKAKLETLEESKQIDVAESSAKISLSFGITDEIEREREKERELERIKRQQERAAAKAAKLEKEREARHRLGIFTPPPEPPATPKPATGAATATAPSPSPASTSAATPTPTIPPTSVPASALPTPASLPMPSPYSAVSTPAATPAANPFPPGANLPYTQQPLPVSQAGSNGFPMSSPQYGPPGPYSSMPGTPYGPAPPFGPSFGPNGMPMPPGVGPMGTPTSVPSMPATTSMPGTPSTPAATPSKPPSKAKAKAAANTSGTPGTPGVTPGPTPHRGRGRPRKHPLPGTPGGPPLGSSVPRKKKEKPPKQAAAATASTPATPGTPGAAAAMSPPAVPVVGASAGMQVRPPSAPVPPTMPGPAPGYSGEMFASTLPPTPTPVRPAVGSPAAPMMVRPPTMHPTLTSATSLNTPRATPPAPVKPSPSPTPPAKANGATPTPATSATAPASAVAPAAAPANANPSIPNHPIPLLIPVASLPRLSALGIQPTPSPHIRPVIGPNGQPQGLQGLPVPIDPAQSVPAVLLGISEGTDSSTETGKQQILHISVVLSRLSPSQLSGLAVLMQSLQAQVEAGKRK